MADLKLIPSVEPGTWGLWAATHPSAHILQAGAWGDLKASFGWTVQRVGLARGNGLVAGAQVLFRRLPAGLGRLAYVPRGPLVDWNDEALTARLFDAVSAAARAGGAIALMVEPELPDDPVQCERMQALGFRAAPVTIQPPRTIVVDIAGDEQAVLADMKSKARYNIRLAERKGVTVRPASEADLPAFHDLMATTGERDAFGVHAPAYYEQAYRLFVPRDWARLLLAEVEGQPVAALMMFALGAKAWYFYGASGNAHREKMPTYLLQWEAIRWARTCGCVSYDLWGVPDADEAELEEHFAERQDGLWGVYRFKRGFGGQVVRSVGAWDRVLAPLRYRLYRWLVTLRRHAQAANQ